MLLTLIFLSAVALGVVAVVNPAGSPRRGEYAALIAIILLALIGAYALNRTGHYALASVVTVTCAVLAPWASVMLDSRILAGDFVPLTYVVLPVLLTGILLSARLTALVTGLQLASLLAFALVVSTTVRINWASLCMMVVFASILSVIANLMNKLDLAQITRLNRELEADEALLREQSVRDHVSGLFNRRYLAETLERELHRAERLGTPLGVIMLDIDHFKPINDKYGHAAGDEVLRRVGELLQADLRAADIACRYGGDEFTMVLPDAPPKVVRQRAEKMRRDAGALEILLLGRPLPSLTLSVGLAVFPDDGATAEALLSASDAALYRAKDDGRDRVVSAAPNPVAAPAPMTPERLALGP